MQMLISTDIGNEGLKQKLVSTIVNKFNNGTLKEEQLIVVMEEVYKLGKLEGRKGKDGC